MWLSTQSTTPSESLLLLTTFNSTLSSSNSSDEISHQRNILFTSGRGSIYRQGCNLYQIGGVQSQMPVLRHIPLRLPLDDL